MYKIGVVIPIYVKTDDHYQYTEKCVKSVTSRNDFVVYLVPTVCEEANIKKLSKLNKCVVISIGENCVARAWNLGIYRALSDLCDYVLVINSDTECYKNTVDDLVLFAENYKNAVMWSAYMDDGHNFIFDKYGFQVVNHETVWHNYSFFMVNRRLFDIVGTFDENIKPAYGEDLDMQYRIELASDFYHDLSIRHICTRNSHYKHLGSATIRYSNNRDNAFNELSQYAVVNGRTSYDYICDKWGGERGRMTFLHPFNNINLDFRYYENVMLE